METPRNDEPCYIISVAARLVEMHPQTLRYYERLGLVKPSRSEGKIRLYSTEDVERLRQIHNYVVDLGVNLAGVEVILKFTEKMAEMEAELERLRAALEARDFGERGQAPEGTNHGI
ncbi:MAG TPA: helix-turn-helix transcriptional regulator [Chloroflexota bacterium]|nr:helix-turn-helix transcriptional regulator [Chloroflexota bacterium]